MTEETKKNEHEHWIHYTIDDEPESTLKHVLTPVEIMTDAGIDQKDNYLEQLVHGQVCGNFLTQDHIARTGVIQQAEGAVDRVAEIIEVVVERRCQGGSSVNADSRNKP